MIYSFKSLIAAPLVATALLVSAPSLAAVHVINLTGTVADSTFNTFTIGPRTYHVWDLQLSGLSPFLLNVGDEVQATVTLDTPFTVPASDEAFLGLNLFQFDGANPTLPVSNTGSMTFFNSGGPTGLPSDTVGTNCGNCLSNIAFFGANAPFTFDSLTATFTIDQLSDVDYLIDSASLSYQLADLTAPVPEPATWGMMILGFGMIGGTMRRRKQATLAVV